MIKPEKQIHPIVRGMVGFAVTVIAATFVTSHILPAWALAVPVGKYVIDLGDLPPWIGAIVAVVVYLEARKARKNAADAAAKATAGVAKIEAVAVQIDGLLAERDKANKKIGKDEEKQAGAEVAAALAQGQSEGRDNERASVAASNQATPQGGVAPAHADGMPPLPVADDRAAEAGERGADALERSAEAQQRVANVAEEKK